MAFDSIPDILDDIRAGRMVVIVDDEDRENEGDLVMAAERVRAEDINFMAREGRGLICLPMTAERCDHLGLKPMVSNNTSQHHTNFTASIEAAEGVTTGISAHDRAHTISVAVAEHAQAHHLNQPGHVFPLIARKGGVLMRAGHTEAATDLAALAGLQPAGVLVEILNDDGTMARRPQLEVFAKRHGLRIGTIADLIRYRLETEKTIERVFESQVETEFGPFRLVAWRDQLHHCLHFALIRGEIDAAQPTLVRVHVSDTLSDVLGLVRDDLGMTLSAALRRVAEQGSGVVVVLAAQQSAEDTLQRLHGKPAVPAPGTAAQQQWRELGLGAQVLSDLGVRKLRVMGTPRRLVGLGGFGLEVAGYDEADAT